MVDKKKTEEKTKLENAAAYIELNAIEIGEDYQAKCERGNYRFTIKPPVVEDDYKILGKFYQLKKEYNLDTVTLSPADEFPLRVMSTLNYVVIKIDKKKERKDGVLEWEETKGSFLEIFNKSMNVSNFYSEIVFPLYEDYLNFKEIIDLSVEDIKKN